ncbi:aminotransferase class I/II-fold pyridoxal phosphate-dependent enzyme [Phocicoccus pinnipedialis]|uniref:Pyridoxal phosphate-dependent aminotransferase EpsN n=1 Tax=Phocicoccus pinnipedialis TaxID=110845 RepID=A0A6V7RNX2_9BACL|nr:aminotransferase class I/II-fold pyridoxal phosphate-dependent enzyme [Jeotgalicoccus pinnipedialis]MBP1938816.1 pyridoxal phosphate-dependent aminotransferase EpsN [Jeotgalicoccus pinnipedialis]CAD2079271.1 Putative pyridoxal phosphate-dependent aminotransferase EpsN [Jeotgalicoccus pinnipedialis]
MSERILLSTPHMSGKELNYINDAFDKNWIAPLGENVDKFEHMIKDYTGIHSSVALSSGTAAIHLALIEAGVKDNDIVFCSTLTFSASANPIIYQNAVPVFIDSEKDTWNMCPDALEKAFIKYKVMNKEVKAVVAVNLYGQSAQYDKIQEICKRYGSILIEDAAESLGSEYHGKKSGTFGDFGVFSFNGNKIITTSGGGMLISNKYEKINHALFLATQAREKAVHYQHEEIGYNYRLSNISAGIGIGQMEVLDERVNRRREIYEIYFKALSDIEGVHFQPEISNSKSNRWLTALTVDFDKLSVKPNELIDYLNVNNIESRPVWKPMHLQPVFKEYDYITLEKDVAKQLFETGICLPSSSNLDDDEIHYVCTKIKEFLG